METWRKEQLTHKRRNMRDKQICEVISNITNREIQTKTIVR
jgi:hypothetical protein